MESGSSNLGFNLKKIGIIFNNMGNISSVLNALNFLQIDAFVSDSISKLEKMDAFILPGVGAFPQAVNNLNSKGFNKFLENKTLQFARNIYEL